LSFTYARDDPKDLRRATELLGEFVRRIGYPHPERMEVVAEALGGNRALDVDAVAVLDDLVRRTPLTPVHILYQYAALSPVDRLFDLMADAVETRHIWVPWIPICALRARPQVVDHPRWVPFLESIDHPGLPAPTH
jgi:hypothetical protein